MVEKNKKIPPFVFVSAGLAVGLGLTALILGGAERASSDVLSRASEETPEQPIPMIDRQVPLQFKTATFALG